MRSDGRWGGRAQKELAQHHRQADYPFVVNRYEDGLQASGQPLACLGRGKWMAQLSEQLRDLAGVLGRGLADSDGRVSYFSPRYTRRPTASSRCPQRRWSCSSGARLLGVSARTLIR